MSYAHARTPEASSLRDLTMGAPVLCRRGVRPLAFKGETLYAGQGAKILISQDLGESFNQLAELQLSRKQTFWASASLLRRVSRSSVYRMRVTNDGQILCLFRGGIWLVDPLSRRARLSMAITKGSRPVSLAISDSGLAVFGEYWPNPDRTPVAIYGSTDYESWRRVYEFPAKTIRHVHGISYDRWERCFWVCTGDYDNECQLLRFDETFQRSEVVGIGGQQMRFYSTLVTKDHLITATDTPLEQNHLVLYTKETGKFQSVAKIENTAFYGCFVQDRAFFSTNAEASSVNDTTHSHIWSALLSDLTAWQKVGSYPIDMIEKLARRARLPIGLFQFPRIFFPEGDNQTNRLFCYGTGLRNVDDTLFAYDI